MNPSAKIICDSVSEAGHRLTTMEVVMHRFVLAEFNTHRVFSRNSASSRAIPVHKRIEQVRSDPMMPFVWASEQKGMQGGEALRGEGRNLAEIHWRWAAQDAANMALKLVEDGLHKSLVNRLLEPFLPHTVVVTSTEWENFFRQRCSPLAQPEIRVVAEHMRDALQASTPAEVDSDWWHLPYLRAGEDREYPAFPYLCEISAARCARVSYLTHYGVHDPEADLSLYERLVSAEPPHASPLEHVAQPLIVGRDKFDGNPGNFTGWSQLRHQVLGF
jgi:hypothetical protein